MRTQEEIIGRTREKYKVDILGFEWHQYLLALTPASVCSLRGEIVKSDVDVAKWKQSFSCDADIRTAAVDYMAFAWEKANNFRGISAGRSMAHYTAWLWLLGEDGFDDLDDYKFYGKNELVRICEYLGLDASQWDDGVRLNNEPGWEDDDG